MNKKIFSVIYFNLPKFTKRVDEKERYALIRKFENVEDMDKFVAECISKNLDYGIQILEMGMQNG